MTNLTNEQKEYIKSAFEKEFVTDFNDMNNEQIRKIKEMNNYETLVQDVNRFLNDLFIVR